MKSFLSLCMIVKDEEHILEKCLESIKSVPDEIIIVDTGSKDRTVEIAKKYTDKVYFFEWIDDFSAARNYCQQFAKGKYVLKWDADFILRDKESENRLLELKAKRFDGVDLVNTTLNLEFNDENIPIKSRPKQLLIYKKEKFHWELPVHNRLVANDGKPFTEATYSEIEIDHYKNPVIKKARYIQTKRLLENQLKSGKNDFRTLMSYAESLFFLKDFHGVIRTLEPILLDPKNTFLKYLAFEKTVMSWLHLGQPRKALEITQQFYLNFRLEKRFQLIYADVLSLFDVTKALQIYLNYLQNPITKEECIGYSYDFERFVIHPSLMVGEIWGSLGDFGKGKPYLELVRDASLLNSSRQKAMLIINKHGKENK